MTWEGETMNARRTRLSAALDKVSHSELPEWEKTDLILVAVRCRPAGQEDAPPRSTDPQGDPIGWALWPSTLQIGAEQFGDDLDPKAPLLEGEWAVEGTSYRAQDGVVTRIDERALAPQELLAEGEVPALRERVTLLCDEPKGKCAVFHVFWTIDDGYDAPARSFDRFVGYEAIE